MKYKAIQATEGFPIDSAGIAAVQYAHMDIQDPLRTERTSACTSVRLLR